MRRLYALLPGPTPVRVLIMTALVVAVLVAVIISYEWLGDYLDSGGALE